MNNAESQRQFMTRYLLGQTTALERTEFERKYLEESEVFEKLVDTENQMIRAYVQNRLSTAERRDFERCYLIGPERIARTQLAKSLLTYGSKIETTVSPATSCPQIPQDVKQAQPLFRRRFTALRVVAATLLVTLIGLGAWMTNVKNSLRGRTRLPAVVQSDTQSRVQQPDPGTHGVENHEPAGSDTGERRLASFPITLTRTITRNGAGQREILVPQAGIVPVPIQLILTQDTFDAYDVVLETVDKAELWQTPNLKSRRHLSQHAIFVTLPSEVFPKGDRRSGDYALKVIGRSPSENPEEVGYYPFRVPRK